MTKARQETLRKMVAQAPISRHDRDDDVEVYEVDLTATPFNLTVSVEATSEATARKKVVAYLVLAEDGAA